MRYVCSLVAGYPRYRVECLTLNHMAKNNELMVQGQALNVTVLPNVQDFVAEKLGVTLPARAKGEKRPTGKEFTALCVAAGYTEEQVKALRKEFDGVRKTHYVNSGIAVAMLAADPNIRKSVRESRNAKGELIGFNATFRKEKSASQTQAVRIAQLEAQLASALRRLTPAIAG